MIVPAPPPLGRDMTIRDSRDRRYGGTQSTKHDERTRRLYVVEESNVGIEAGLKLHKGRTIGRGNARLRQREGRLPTGRRGGRALIIDVRTWVLIAIHCELPFHPFSDTGARRISLTGGVAQDAAAVTPRSTEAQAFEFGDHTVSEYTESLCGDMVRSRVHVPVRRIWQYDVPA
ncbi:hypothetical protein PM082_015479 [Marasmius tenuissimus]|nr:hypothetical protein PM082_015479 [Marasmius tenuissimus]